LEQHTAVIYCFFSSTTLKASTKRNKGNELARVLQVGCGRPFAAHALFITVIYPPTTNLGHVCISLENLIGSNPDVDPIVHLYLAFRQPNRVTSHVHPKMPDASAIRITPSSASRSFSGGLTRAPSPRIKAKPTVQWSLPSQAGSHTMGRRGGRSPGTETEREQQ
jgi:hypothetical protein